MTGKDIRLRSSHQGSNRLWIRNLNYASLPCSNNHLNTHSLSVFHSFFYLKDSKQRSWNNFKKFAYNRWRHIEQNPNDFKKENPTASKILLTITARISPYFIDSLMKERCKQLTILKNIKSHPDQQWAENHKFLYKLQALESESELYLCPHIFAKSLIKHTENNKWLTCQLKLNERLKKRFTRAKQNTISILSNKAKQRHAEIVRDLIKQEQQSKIANTLNKTAWQYKLKSLNQVQRETVKAIVEIEQYQPFKFVSRENKHQHLNIFSPLIIAYNIKAKIKECLASSKDNAQTHLNFEWLASASYLKVLNYEKNKTIILNNLVCLLRDIKEPEDAFGLHLKASQIQSDELIILSSISCCLYRERAKQKEGRRKDKGRLNPFLLVLTCEFLLKKLQLNEALIEFNQALSLNTSSYNRALYQHSLIYKILNQLKLTLIDSNATLVSLLTIEKGKKLCNIISDIELANKAVQSRKCWLMERRTSCLYLH